VKPLFNEDDKSKIKVNVKKAVEFLGLSKLKSPEDFIRLMRNPAVVDGRRIYDPEVYSKN
jgi:hypothetical protein